MDNAVFLDVIKESFKTYLDVGTSRSTAKLKMLHGRLAADLKEKLGDEYDVKSQGIDDGKEGVMEGRYYPKNVDITVYRNGKAVAGYAVKFVMRNYSQNSNNYFENMLGETANIRANAIPYFQVFIIFDKVPYYEKGGQFKKYDVITQHNIDKYLALSRDNPAVYFHTPDKMLFVLVHLKETEATNRFDNEKEYAEYYKSMIDTKGLLSYSTKIEDVFDSTVIYNDYVNFINRSCHIILGKLK